MSRKVTMSVEAREEMFLWARSGICVVCGDPECRPVEGHHVLYQQWLCGVAGTRGLDARALLEDRRGWLRVGQRCHRRHHGAYLRIPRAVLAEHCPEVFDMAAELNLTSRLERTYPELVVA